MIKPFRDMEVWQQSVNLSAQVYKETAVLPQSEDYGLTSQLRRSANSVSANIAEGFGRKGKISVDFILLLVGLYLKLKVILFTEIKSNILKNHLLRNCLKNMTI